MDKHAFTFEQYCNIVGKNIILEETTYHNGNKKIRCLNLHKCRITNGGCSNPYIIRRIEKAVEKSKEE
ncbi:MAG: hypothetical protein J6A49_09040 [Clostridia bacterium]|nr:hypothetical protein [Clostridia bacterium]